MTQQKTTSPSAGLGESMQAMLSRVRGALKHSQTQPPDEPAPAVDEMIARTAPSDADHVALFKERAVLVGMQVHPVTQAQVADCLRERLQACGAKCVGIAAGVTGEQLADAIESAMGDSVTSVAWHATPDLAGQYELDAGITDVHAAIAETGTLVCNSGSRSSRGLSLVPPVHIALVRASDIVPDMIDYWNRLKGLPHTELPSSQAFITGPSKTADIEGELVTGVHGPGEVHIVLIADL